MKIDNSEVYVHFPVWTNNSHIISQNVQTFDEWITIWYH